uniref:30S ribosomal protein S6, chloroplastic n=1 Tax=Callithamnion tetricum TaxID=193179 RepID=A0A4D6WRP1_9FLOR|nr:ribosomal protein S6 [Callithamnion tetricum]
MSLNSYETIYILKPDVTENTNLKLVNFYKALIKKKGGQDILVQHRGRRHLSYSMNKSYDGIYVQINYKGNGSILELMEKSMKLNESIMRYLTVKQSAVNTINVYS